MALDGLSRRLAKVEAEAGGAGVPCDKCGQAGPPLEGEALELALREAAEQSRAKPHVVDARAQTYACQKCGRPCVLVVATVNNWRSGGFQE